MKNTLYCCIGFLTILVLMRRLCHAPRLPFTAPDPDDDLRY